MTTVKWQDIYETLSDDDKQTFVYELLITLDQVHDCRNIRALISLYNRWRSKIELTQIVPEIKKITNKIIDTARNSGILILDKGGTLIDFGKGIIMEKEEKKVLKAEKAGEKFTKKKRNKMVSDKTETSKVVKK